METPCKPWLSVVSVGELLPGVEVVPERENFALRFGKDEE